MNGKPPHKYDSIELVVLGLMAALIIVLAFPVFNNAPVGSQTQAAHSQQ